MMVEMIEQGTDAWLESRLGRVTASRLADVVAKTKTGVSASRAGYMAEIVAERLTGKQAASFTNAAMAWGTDAEPLARAAYEAERGLFVIETGMVPHPVIPMTGASPDGLVMADGLIEIKCPETKTHIETIQRSTSLKCNGKWPALIETGATSHRLIQGCQQTCNFSSHVSNVMTS
jgi:hypothetical protein